MLALHTVCSSSMSAEGATVRDTGNLVYFSQQRWGMGPGTKFWSFDKVNTLAFKASACRSWHESGLPMQTNLCKVPPHQGTNGTHCGTRQQNLPPPNQNSFRGMRGN